MSLPKTAFTSYQKFVVALLAFLQFTIILDFMIISPMGALLMPALNITPTQFGVVVSAYAFSAGVSGILASGFADRFDRKKFLLFFYIGFVVGTLCCGIAPTYHFLLVARMVTGIFGGVIGSIVLAITTDLFPLEMRGRVMGAVQTAFGASQVLGIPAGLYFSNLWGWHAPFLMIVIVSTLVGLIIVAYLKPVDGHLKLRVDKNAFHHFRETISIPGHLVAFATTGLISIGGFMLMPFGSAFTVHNLGIEMGKLPIIYLVTGIFAILTGPVVGKLSDSFGKFKTFVFGAVLTIIMVNIYTRLGVTPLFWVVVVNAVMFIGIFSRMIPSQALISSIPAPASRGSFMAVNSSLQQISGGLASVLAGYIVSSNAEGAIQHFDTLGLIVSFTAILTIGLMYQIHRTIPENI